ncbi:phosphoenolpyruvate carboxykinase (GTP) [Candidatus Woesearchaeota archaeon]|nr:phosphoenolpyruvate carboxykinase (GTP) [Candidatus Woesearchaeota archaeon]
MNINGSEKLASLKNKKVEKILDEYITLLKPASVTILNDSEKDQEYIKQLAVKNNEEKPLKMEGHTIHYDSPKDQGRDLVNTRVLVKPGVQLGKAIKTTDREEGLKEVFEIMDGIMEGKEMLVKFYCLGPHNSKFSLPAMQITDSAYVLHSEDILYRQGFDMFKELDDFFLFVHSAGKLENGVCVDIDKRRVYMDLDEERVFTVNNQYAGNSVGLKKLALRLAISKANKEDWLCEHMFLMGAKRKGRITYFTGAFPSACGKTSTAMIPGQSIIGDDIAYIRPDEEGYARGVNVEQGIFGIIADVNPKDDPLIYKTLTSPREIIFSNVLVQEDIPYWLNMGKDLPSEGTNFIGKWKKGMTVDGKEVLAAHKNARFCLRISELENVDENLHNPEGVRIRGFIYGGRDSDTNPPLLQSLSWAHGVYIGASVESETTAAALGKEGVRKHNPMSNVEFLVVPLGVYIENHLKFGEGLDVPPLIFSTNYFLKEDGEFLNAKTDKKVWLMWMEGRVHEEFGALETPIGFIPKYEDLKKLFEMVFSKAYTKNNYEEQFSIKTGKLLERLDRIEEIYKVEEDIPQMFHDHLEQQRERLKDAQKKLGDVISPFKFE